MWARIAEALLAGWLMASPFVFGHEGTLLVAHDLACGGLIFVLSLLSFTARFRRAHLGTALLALWLAGLGWVETREAPTPAAQNHIVIGLLFLMFAIIPSHASAPTDSWRKRWS